MIREPTAHLTDEEFVGFVLDDCPPDVAEVIDRLLRGEQTGLPAHPILPTGDPRDVVKFDFEWDLDGAPRQLWPHVSNTDRLDRAI